MSDAIIVDPDSGALGRFRLNLSKAGRIGLLLFAGVWVILQNNSRISDNVPDHAAFSLLTLPRALRVVEALALMAAFVALQPTVSRSRQRGLNTMTWVFIGIAIVGVCLTPTGFVSQFQGIYAYLAPILLFMCAWLVRPDQRWLGQFILLFVAYVAINIPVAMLVQLPPVGLKGDHVHGFFSDAHVFGAFLAVGSCVAFTRFIEAGGVRLLLLAGFLFFVSYYPANEKMIIFNMAWCGAVLAMRLLRRPTGRRGLAVLAGSVVLATVTVSSATGDDWFRLGLLKGRGLTEQDRYRSWSLAWRALDLSPVRLLVGLGPANFAGLAAVRAALTDPRALKVLTPTARQTLLEEPGLEGGLGWSTNTWANLFAEFGVLGLLTFGLLLWGLSYPVWRWRPARPIDRVAQLLFFAMFGAVLWQGAITVYSNWSDPILAYPLMAIAAYCHRAAALQSPKRTMHPPVPSAAPPAGAS